MKKNYKQASWQFSNEHFPFLKINFYFRRVAYMEEQVGNTWLELLQCNLFLYQESLGRFTGLVA